MDERSKSFLGRGWAFPPAIDPVRGRVASVEHERDIKQSIRIILATAKGERVMRPDFGCGIHDLVFGAISRLLITQVEQSVTEALRDFEARIDVDNINVNASGAVDGLLIVHIDYTVRATNQPGNFVYPFYFKEAQ